MTEKNSDITEDELNKILNEKLENLEVLEKIGKDSNYIKELSDIALLQLKLKRYEESEGNYMICLRHFNKQKDRLGEAAVLGILGVLFFEKCDYIKSIEFYEKAFNIYKELNQVQEQITCLKGIGNCYIKLNKLDDACNTFLNCSAICSDNNDIYSLLDCLGNLIYIHENTEQWDVVFELYKKSLKAFREIQDKKGIITSYFNLGILQKKNYNFEDAIRYFKKGTNKAIDSNYAELILKGLSYVGETYFYLGKNKDAMNQFIKALHLAEKIKAENAIIQLKILLRSLGLQDNQIFEELKKYKESHD
ncbi:MAG: tetratricopeptide repeat protein [Candidatus Thorarchaeota archaeon]